MDLTAWLEFGTIKKVAECQTERFLLVLNTVPCFQNVRWMSLPVFMTSQCVACVQKLSKQSAGDLNSGWCFEPTLW